jgi:hypothetical protein
MTKQQQKIIEYLSVEGSWAHNTYRDTYGNPWNFDDLIVYSPDNGVPEESHVPQVVTHVWLDRVGKLSVRLSKKMQFEIERPASSYKDGEEEIGLSYGTYNQQNPFTEDFHFEHDNLDFRKKYQLDPIVTSVEQEDLHILAASVCISDDLRGLASHAMVFACKDYRFLPRHIWHLPTWKKFEELKSGIIWNGKLWQFPDGKEIQTHEWTVI